MREVHVPARNIVIGQKVSSAQVRRVKELRREMTGAEKTLWQRLRNNRLNGWHFRRQQIVGGFFADFYCHAAALVIENDGSVHMTQKEYDSERSWLIREYGIEVIRFTNEEIENQLEQVIEKIDHLCQECTSTPSLVGKGLGDRSSGSNKHVQ
jgi:very-short-patch-repair endonuclease